MSNPADIAAKTVGSTSSITVAVLLASLVFAASRIFLPIHYAENDDVVMRMLVSGAYSGQIDPLLVFQNFYFSSALGALYALAPGIDWYSNSILGLHSLAHATLLVSFLKGRRLKTVAAVLTAGCLLAIFLATTIQMQFTTTAGALSASGVAAILLASNRPYAVFGAVMLLFGFLIRFEAAALTLAIVAPLCLAALLELKSCKSALTIIAMTLLVALTLHVASEWRMSALAPDYLAFNDFRGGVNDNPNNSLNPERLPAGVSANDYELLVEFLPEIQRFTPDLASQIALALARNERQLGLTDVLAAFARTVENPVLLLILLLLLLTFFAAANRTDRTLSLATLAVVCGFLVYLELTADVKERVQLVIASSVLVAILIRTPISSSRMSEWARVLPLLLILPLLVIQSGQRIVENSHLQIQFSNQKKTLEQWPGAVIVFKNHFRVTGAPAFSDELDHLEGRLVFAGWVTGHPANIARYDDHASFLENGNALYYDPNRSTGSDPVRMIQFSLSENHGIETRAETYASGPFGRLVAFRRFE